MFVKYVIGVYWSTDEMFNSLGAGSIGEAYYISRSEANSIGTDKMGTVSGERVFVRCSCNSEYMDYDAGDNQWSCPECENYLEAGTLVEFIDAGDLDITEF